MAVDGLSEMQLVQTSLHRRDDRRNLIYTTLRAHLPRTAWNLSTAHDADNSTVLPVFNMS